MKTKVNLNPTHLKFLQLIVDTSEVLTVVNIGQLILQLVQSLVQALIALHDQVSVVGLKELTGFGLGSALKILPAVSDLLQLFTDHWAELWLLLN